MVDDRGLLRAWRVAGVRRGLEASSLRRREDDMKCLSAWCGGRLLDLRPDEIEQFLDQRIWRGRHLGSRTRYKWLSTISTFFQWAMREDLIGADPTVKIERPRLRRLLPRPWLTEDAEQAIGSANARMRCWLLLAAYGGLRCMEIAAAAREDVIDADAAPMLVVHGKGSKDRVVPLHPRILDSLVHLPMPRRGPLWIHPASGRPWTAAQVSKDIADHFDALDMTWTAHQGRHWFGTQTLEACGDLRVVQELMGHESITTTTGYTQWSRKRASEAVAGLPVPVSCAPVGDALFIQTSSRPMTPHGRGGTG